MTANPVATTELSVSSFSASSASALASVSATMSTALSTAGPLTTSCRLRLLPSSVGPSVFDDLELAAFYIRPHKTVPTIQSTSNTPTAGHTGWPKNWHNSFVRLNFIKNYPIFKIISLSANTFSVIECSLCMPAKGRSGVLFNQCQWVSLCGLDRND